MTRPTQFGDEPNFFAEEIEVDYSKLLRYTVNDINKTLLELPPENIEFDYEYKRHMAKHIAIQFLRLEEIREAISYNINDMKQAIKGLLERSNLYDKECAKSMQKSIEASEDEVLNHFFFSYGDEELIKTYTNQLCKNYWTMYISQGSYFYTSDFPISVSPEKKDVQLECMGLAQEGGVVIFPISKNILLKIRDCRHFTDYKNLDCKCCPATEKLVRQENIRQYLYAKELVISPTNHFEIPQFMNSYNGKELFMHPNFKTMTFNK